MVALFSLSSPVQRGEDEREGVDRTRGRSPLFRPCREERMIGRVSIEHVEDVLRRLQGMRQARVEDQKEEGHGLERVELNEPMRQQGEVVRRDREENTKVCPTTRMRRGAAMVKEAGKKTPKARLRTRTPHDALCGRRLQSSEFPQSFS